MLFVSNNFKDSEINCVDCWFKTEEYSKELNFINVEENFDFNTKNEKKIKKIKSTSDEFFNSNKKTFDFKKLAFEIHKFSKRKRCKIILEPGRSIIGDTAVLISKVIYIKESPTKDFIILDAGMNDLIRPALYNAKHMIIPAIKSSKKSKKEYDFVGPICETSDRFLKMKKFQKLNEGEIVILKDVGAYGYVLSSNYNVRPMPKEVLVDKSKTQIISKRQSIKDLI